MHMNSLKEMLHNIPRIRITELQIKIIQVSMEAEINIIKILVCNITLIHKLMVMLIIQMVQYNLIKTLVLIRVWKYLILAYQILLNMEIM